MTPEKKVQEAIDALVSETRASGRGRFGDRGLDLSDPLQGFDIVVEGLGLSPVRVYIKEEGKKFVIETGLTTSMLEAGMRIPARQLRLSMVSPLGGPNVAFAEITPDIGSEFFKVETLLAEAGRSVAMVCLSISCQVRYLPVEIHTDKLFE